jgi:hypothetical protein
MYISAEMHGACTMCLYSCMFICDLSPSCYVSLSVECALLWVVLEKLV